MEFLILINEFPKVSSSDIGWKSASKSPSPIFFAKLAVPFSELIKLSKITAISPISSSDFLGTLLGNIPFPKSFKVSLSEMIGFTKTFENIKDIIKVIPKMIKPAIAKLPISPSICSSNSEASILLTIPQPTLGMLVQAANTLLLL